MKIGDGEIKPVAWRYRTTIIPNDYWHVTTVPPWNWGTRLAIEDQPLYTAKDLESIVEDIMTDAMRTLRHDTLEQCARLADDKAVGWDSQINLAIAIRKLKHKRSIGVAAYELAWKELK